MSPVKFAQLPSEVRQGYHETLTPRGNRFIPRTLTVENRNAKQRLFLYLLDREVFYGGAAGGAKTAGILAAALQYVDQPHYDALLLRENFKQLNEPGSWIPLAHEWLGGTQARWNQGAKRWTFPSGATLTFGFVNPRMTDDVRKYQTAAYHFIGIDELTGWNEDDYRFLFSRLRRRSGSGVPPRMRAASNPGGRGHEWVRKRFVDEVTRRATARFIPAALHDNPYLDADDYVRSLQELHPIHWQRLLHGDWSVSDPGSLFMPRVWLTDADFLDDPPPMRDVALCVRYWDLAASEPSTFNPDPDYTAGARISRLRDGRYCWEHLVRFRRTPHQTELSVARTASDDRGRVRVQYIEQTPGMGKSVVDHYKRDVIPEGIIVQGDTGWSGKSKGVRARPLAALMERHKMLFVRAQWNEDLFDEQESFSEDPQHSGAHDDQVDCGSGAVARLMARPSSGTITHLPRGSVAR